MCEKISGRMKRLVAGACFIAVSVPFLSFTSCSFVPKAENVKSSAVLLFNSGFEPGTKIKNGNNAFNSDDDLIGEDNSVSRPNNWITDLDNSSLVGRFNLQYQGGDTTQRFARIIPEPGNPSNHVLHFWLNEANVDGSKGRIQANLYGAEEGLKEFYQSVRVFLPEDFNTVRRFPDKISWLTIVEFWNNITWSQSVPHGFRITLGIGKAAGADSDLYFILDGQDCELFPDNSQKYTTLWADKSIGVNVPVQKWFTMDYYYKEGNCENGRFWMAVTPEGGEKQVVFDIKNFTHNSNDNNPDGVTDFNPMKLYTSKKLIDYMRSHGNTLQIYWDDFKLWKDKTPEP